MIHFVKSARIFAIRYRKNNFCIDINLQLKKKEQINMENTTTFKPFDELVCSDNFMFAKVMEDPMLCKRVLETLLDIKIERLSYPESEKTIQVAPDAKAVRLDVHTADTHRDFDIEMIW